MKECGREKVMECETHFYILCFRIKCKWNELVECEVNYHFYSKSELKLLMSDRLKLVNWYS